MRRRDLWPPLLLLGTFAILLVANLGHTRTYALSAETGAADIAVDGRTPWFLGAATLCVPREAALRRAPDGTGPARCDGRIYEERAEPSLTVEWPPGAELSLRRETGELSILVRSGAGALPDGTVVFLPDDSLRAAGALTFSGRMRIGAQMATGARGHLVAGDYTIRETSHLSGLLGRRSEVVKQGSLTRGDVVSVVQGGPDFAPATGFGQVTLSDSGQFDAVFRASAPAAAIRVEALGLDDALVRSDWIDTLLASPYLIVIGAFFGVLVNILSFCFELMDRMVPAGAGADAARPGSHRRWADVARLWARLRSFRK